MILGLFFRVGVLCVLIVTLVHLVALWDSGGGFQTRLPALEMSILLVSVLFIGPESTAWIRAEARSGGF